MYAVITEWSLTLHAQSDNDVRKLRELYTVLRDNYVAAGSVGLMQDEKPDEKDGFVPTPYLFIPQCDDRLFVEYLTWVNINYAQVRQYRYYGYPVLDAPRV